MSSPIRRVFVALGFMATLFLVAPSPSCAAGFPNPLMKKGFAVRVWSWLESLLPGSAVPTATAGRTVRLHEKEGSAIDPNGAPRPAGSPAPASAANSDQGSGIDPNGK